MSHTYDHEFVLQNFKAHTQENQKEKTDEMSIKSSIISSDDSI